MQILRRSRKLRTIELKINKLEPVECVMRYVRGFFFIYRIIKQNFYLIKVDIYKVVTGE